MLRTHGRYIRLLSFRLSALTQTMQRAAVGKGDVFNLFALELVKQLPKYDPARGKLTTWLSDCVAPRVWRNIKYQANKRSGPVAIQLSCMNGPTRGRDREDYAPPDTRGPDPARAAAERIDAAERTERVRAAVEQLAGDDRETALAFLAGKSGRLTDAARERLRRELADLAPARV